MATAPVSPVPPSPSIPKSLLEEVTGCLVVTYIIEDGSKPGDNFMSVIYSVTAEVIPPDEDKKEVRHYLFKCYPRHPSRQSYLNKTNMFHNELSFYSIWVKALQDFQGTVLGIPDNKIVRPAFPPYIGGKAINYAKLEDPIAANSKVYHPTDNFLVMTDLRKALGYSMLRIPLGLEFDHISLAVKELAKTHALSWAYRQKVEWNLLEKFPFLKCTVHDDNLQMWGEIVRQNVQIAVKSIDEALGQGNHLSKPVSDFESKVEKVIELFVHQKEAAEKDCWNLHRNPPEEMVNASENEKLWRVICHGDTWCNNLLFKCNETSGKPEHVILIDFQLAGEGCPTGDLVHILYTGTTVDFRRQHLHEVLKVYHDKFNEVCSTLKVDSLPDFSMEVLKRKFHKSKLIGFMMAVNKFPMMLKESNTTTVNLEHVNENTKIDDMLLDASSVHNGSSLYKTRILDIAKELFDEGVI